MLSKFSIISVSLGAALMFNVATASAQGQASYGLGTPAQAADLPSGAFRSALEALPPQARGRALGLL